MVKYFFAVLAFNIFCVCAAAQTITQYQYWFDNNYGSAVTQTVSSPSTVLSLNTTVSTAGLSTGYHSVNFRAEDNSGHWSATESSFFYKKAVNVVNYQYWYDNNYAGAVTQTVSPASQLDLNNAIATSPLSSGIHTINFRSLDAGNKWSVVASSNFYEATLVAAYRYWVNSNYGAAQTVTLATPLSVLDLNISIPCSDFSHGQDTLYFEVENNFGKWSSVTADIFTSNYVVPSLSIASSGSTVCAGTNVTFTPTPVLGGTSPSYQWMVNGINTGTAATYTYAPANGDVVSCVLTSSLACANPNTAASNNITMTVNPVPDPGTITGMATTCAGSTTSLSDLSGGGIWSSNNIGVAEVAPGTGVVSGVAPGTAGIIYTLAGACPATVTVIVTVDALPAISAGSGVVISAGSSTGLTATGGVSYTWSPSSGLSASTGASVTASPGSTTTYTVTGTNSNGCSNTSAVIVTVNPLIGEDAITGATMVCLGSATTLGDAATGGVWSSDNTGVATVNNSSGVVKGIAPGTATISYTATDVFATIVVTVGPFAGTITGLTDVEKGAMITLFDAVGGGTWSSANAGVATIDASSGLVGGVAAGTNTIYYTVTNSCGTAKASFLIGVSSSGCNCH